MIFLIASDCFSRIRVVSRVMVIHAVVLVYRVVNNVVLRVHILALKVVTFLFHRRTKVLSQCTTFLPSLWLPCILFLVLFSSIRRALLLNI